MLIAPGKTMIFVIVAVPIAKRNDWLTTENTKTDKDAANHCSRRSLVYSYLSRDVRRRRGGLDKLS